MSLQYHRRARLFPHLNFGRCVGQQLCEMQFYQIQIIPPAVEPEHRHQVSPFHYRPTSLCCEQLNILWHELRFYRTSDVFTAPLQLSHEFSRSALSNLRRRCAWATVQACRQDSPKSARARCHT